MEMEGPVVQIPPRWGEVILQESSSYATLILEKWDGKEIKHMIPPIGHTELWKVLGEENWNIIYSLSERGYQPELS